MNQPIRVLIVDDQPSARKGLKALLAFYPEILVVGEAVNGQEAVQLVAEQRPHVVVMDLQMPVMDGVAATRLIKTRWPAIKVIVLTVQAARRGEALAAGADTFLLKGNGPEALQNAILGETESTFGSDFNRCSKAVVPEIAPNNTFAKLSFESTPQLWWCSNNRRAIIPAALALVLPDFLDKLGQKIRPILA